MYNKKTQLRKEADRLAWVATIKIRGIDCEICGEPMEDVHHCYRKGMYPHLRYDLDNLSILCRECHDKPDRTILNLLEEKRGKEWRKRLDEKAKEDIHKRITISWYEDNIKKLKHIMKDSNKTDIIEEIIDIQPFSTNKLFQGKRYRTKEYKQYSDGALMIMPKLKMIKGQVAIFFRFYCRSNRSDLDNFYKSALDLITKKGWIQDDSYVYFLQGQKILVKTKEEQRIEVKIIKM